MSNYKVGDKFEIEIEKILENATSKGNALYRMKGFASLVFDDYGLGLLKKLETPEEKSVDWERVSIDTPIFVRDDENQRWIPRHFAKYENGIVYAWENGVTSFVSQTSSPIAWLYAKLAEDM